MLHTETENAGDSLCFAIGKFRIAKIIEYIKMHIILSRGHSGYFQLGRCKDGN